MFKVARVILPLVLLLALIAGGCQTSSEPPDETGPSVPGEGTQIGNLAPDFQLKDLDGKTVSLSDLRGKPVLLNFWATRCPPCRFEMPFLQQIYEEWSDRGLVLLAIDIGESSAGVKEFLEDNNLSLPVLLDSDQRVALRYSITNIPTTYFIDRNGIIRQKVIGAFPNKEAIEKQLDKIVP